MDPLQQLLTQRALAQAQAPNQGFDPNQGQGQLPDSGYGDGGGAIAQMLGNSMGSPGVGSPMGGGQIGPPGMSPMPQMGIGRQPAMRMPQGPPQQQGAPYQPQDSANDRNYV